MSVGIRSQGEVATKDGQLGLGYTEVETPSRWDLAGPPALRRASIASSPGCLRSWHFPLSLSGRSTACTDPARQTRDRSLQARRPPAYSPASCLNCSSQAGPRAWALSFLLRMRAAAVGPLLPAQVSPRPQQVSWAEPRGNPGLCACALLRKPALQRAQANPEAPTICQFRK